MQLYMERMLALSEVGRMKYLCEQCNGWLFTIDKYGLLMCHECHLGGYITYEPNGEIVVGEEE